MADNLVIGFELLNLMPALAGIKKVQDAVAAIQTNLKGAKNAAVVVQNATINAMVINGGQVTINQKSGSSTGGRRSSSSSSPGSTPASSFMQRLNTFISSSRFSMGGSGGGPSIMPLVGQALKLLGPEFASLSGPIAALVTPVVALTGAANAAAAALTEFRASMITSGGTAMETAQLKGLGAAAGVSDMASLSRQLSDKIKNDGPSSAAAHNAGVYDYGNAMSGPTDKAKNLLKVIDYIMDKNTSLAEAQRTARQLDLEAFLPLRDLSEQMKQNFKDTEALAAASNTPELQRQTAEYNAALGRLGIAFDTFKLKLGSRFLPIMTQLADAAANALDRLSRLFDQLSEWWDKQMGVPHKQQKAQEDALKDHTAAMREHAQALRAGVYGGGERARGAMPSAWGGSNARNWTGQTAALGAFSL